MTLAIQWGFPPYSDLNKLPTTQGFIYFDAVTSYKKSFSGSVSKHPIDKGGLISDHFTRENPIITLSVVISSVDISVNGVRVSDLEGNLPTNNRRYFESVKNNSTDKSLVNYLPDVVGQFFTPKKPDIVLAPQPVDTLKKIQLLLESLFLNNNVEPILLYEYKNSNLTDAPTRNLVMTSLTFNESADSGEGLHCDITLEQVTFVNTKKTQIPSGIRESLVSDDLAKKAEALKSEGKVNAPPRSLDNTGSILYKSGSKADEILTNFFSPGGG